MFRLISIKGRYWPYQLTLHFVVMEVCIRGTLLSGAQPSDENLTSFADTAGTASQWVPGLVAVA